LIIGLKSLCDAGLKLGLIGFVFGGFGFDWVCFGFELGLIGFELGLFLGKILVFGAKSGQIGFVLHKKVFLCDRPGGAWSVQRIAYSVLVIHHRRSPIH